MAQPFESARAARHGGGPGGGALRAPRSEIEKIKEESRGLRGTIAEELAGDAASLSETAKHPIKHHGVYEQDDRDLRHAPRENGADKAWSFMVRTECGIHLDPVARVGRRK